ncbi:MAG: hypothetical protein V8S99_04565 [Oscillospiraceae bacterium]
MTVETVTLKKDDEGHVTGYTKTTETTGSVTDETVKPEVPDQATVGKDGDTTYSFELPEKPEITTPVQRERRRQARQRRRGAAADRRPAVT